jgi:hypothetical protein
MAENRPKHLPRSDEADDANDELPVLPDLDVRAEDGGLVKGGVPKLPDGGRS